MRTLSILTTILTSVAAMVLFTAPSTAQQRGDAASRPNVSGSSSVATGAAQKAAPFTRTTDGKPNMQGYWDSPQAGWAAWDIEKHPDGFQILGGPGAVVDPPDGKIPYQPWGLEKRQYFIDHPKEDPQAHCFLSGVPRQWYTPFGLQILQPPGAPYILVLHESHHAYRVIKLDGKPHLPPSIKLFEGDSVAKWEGDTLVIDVKNLNGKTWFDMAGNFTTENLHVVERLTMANINTINYEATIEDSTLYTRPWKIAFTITRITKPNYELMEFACYEGERDLEHYVEGATLK